MSEFTTVTTITRNNEYKNIIVNLQNIETISYQYNSNTEVYQKVRDEVKEKLYKKLQSEHPDWEEWEIHNEIQNGWNEGRYIPDSLVRLWLLGPTMSWKINGEFYTIIVNIDRNHDQALDVQRSCRDYLEYTLYNYSLYDWQNMRFWSDEESPSVEASDDFIKYKWLIDPTIPIPWTWIDENGWRQYLDYVYV